MMVYFVDFFSERTKLVVPPDMTKCLKLIDDTNQWSETASEVSIVKEQNRCFIGKLQ